MRCLACSVIIAVAMSAVSCIIPPKKDLSCAPSNGNAIYDQENHIVYEGVVKDREGRPLIDVKVTCNGPILDARRCTYTDNKGRWRLVVPKADVPYSIRFEKPDYVTIVRQNLRFDDSHYIIATLYALSDKDVQWVD